MSLKSKVTFKRIIKSLVPPIVFQGYRALQGSDGNTVLGDYASWAEALSVSTGYDSEIILEKTRSALLKVKRGQAVYERDSVLFDKIEYSWPLLAGLMWIAAQSGGRLNVLDFGGALGSTYFQNLAFLRAMCAVRWNVVEQPRHVEVGRQWFEDEALKFYPTIEACLAETQPNVVILSGVLQYLEHPYQILDKLLSLPLNHVVIDRTSFWDGPEDKLCVQHVPSTIYQASYPMWIFSRQHFLAYVGEKWLIQMEFDSLDKMKSAIPFEHGGIMLTRRDPKESLP